MKKYLLLVCALSCIVFAKAKDWTQYVNPLMGSQSSFELSTGNTYPAIARPWGMNFWTPQTGKMGDGWQYTYTANKIRGFKQTHQPSPWINDYGQFSIMPVVGKPEFNEEKRASWFAHKGEIATPYYYKVYLAEHDVQIVERVRFPSFSAIRAVLTPIRAEFLLFLPSLWYIYGNDIPV